jgi:ribosomal protein S18 acetylase RimI-like enzyme
MRKFYIEFGDDEEDGDVLDAHQWICVRKMMKQDVERVNKIDAKSMESHISLDWFSSIIDSAPDLQHVACDCRTDPMNPQTILGYVVGRPYDPANKHQIGYISRIAVLAPYRRHGIGTMLESAFEYALLARGVPAIRVHARVTNDTALRFYDGRGFAITAQLPGHYKKPAGDGYALEKQVLRGTQNFRSCFPL